MNEYCMYKASGSITQDKFHIQVVFRQFRGVANLETLKAPTQASTRHPGIADCATPKLTPQRKAYN